MVSKGLNFRQPVPGSVLERVKNFLFRRQDAYRQVFNREGALTDAVLRDLAHFCRAHQSTFHPDARVQAHLEGRREVWLRIQTHLHLTNDELWDLHRKEV